VRRMAGSHRKDDGKYGVRYQLLPGQTFARRLLLPVWPHVDVAAVSVRWVIRLLQRSSPDQTSPLEPQEQSLLETARAHHQGDALVPLRR
jgi:hypothetical protein